VFLNYYNFHNENIYNLYHSWRTIVLLNIFCNESVSSLLQPPLLTVILRSELILLYIQLLQIRQVKEKFLTMLKLKYIF